MKKKLFNKIAILGESEKFLKEIKKNFKYKLLDVYPWRELNEANNKKKTYNLILVCGFDFSLYSKSFEFFCKKNIYDPLKILKSISNNKSLIIYINTKNFNNREMNYTFSRYKFAKQFLANKIHKIFKNHFIFEANLITVNNKISINANIFSKFIFLIFYKLRLIKGTKIENIFPFINKNLYKKKFTQKNIYGYLLNFPRTQFIDRALRLILK